MIFFTLSQVCARVYACILCTLFFFFHFLLCRRYASYRLFGPPPPLTRSHRVRSRISSLFPDANFVVDLALILVFQLSVLASKIERSLH